MIRYSVCCRGSMNEKSAKCFQGGGWMSDTPDPPCPHCGKPMFCTAVISETPISADSGGLTDG